ncbi:hypothetical protein J8273_5181 [Carpediemonas membranifera]|uniref:Uncharacterized protein n=1 Tax=Carpediemonas membranifera TaxID=201153 RepID=A0A8J6DYG6_9EUKA|nr:hypothetical protein J8273_5181 [Carpediemonas membranifera]|eukprot:KAG9392199.1 hypothetical protein J8273_5181 [Carpediemonas membranifera]
MDDATNSLPDGRLTSARSSSRKNDGMPAGETRQMSTKITQDGYNSSVMAVHAFQATQMPSFPGTAMICSPRQFHAPSMHNTASISPESIFSNRHSQILLQKSPLKPTAQALLDRARSILADGPPLSMNVELAEGQELPVALHTLLQGTLWAVMMASGVNRMDCFMFMVIIPLSTHHKHSCKSVPCPNKTCGAQVEFMHRTTFFFSPDMRTAQALAAGVVDPAHVTRTSTHPTRLSPGACPSAQPVVISCSFCSILFSDNKNSPFSFCSSSSSPYCSTFPLILVDAIVWALGAAATCAVTPWLALCLLSLTPVVALLPMGTVKLTTLATRKYRAEAFPALPIPRVEVALSESKLVIANSQKDIAAVSRRVPLTILEFSGVVDEAGVLDMTRLSDDDSAVIAQSLQTIEAETADGMRLFQITHSRWPHSACTPASSARTPRTPCTATGFLAKQEAKRDWHALTKARPVFADLWRHMYASRGQSSASSLVYYLKTVNLISAQRSQIDALYTRALNHPTPRIVRSYAQYLSIIDPSPAVAAYCEELYGVADELEVAPGEGEKGRIRVELVDTSSEASSGDNVRQHASGVIAFLLITSFFLVSVLCVVAFTYTHANILCKMIGLMNSTIGTQLITAAFAALRGDPTHIVSQHGCRGTVEALAERYIGPVPPTQPRHLPCRLVRSRWGRLRPGLHARSCHEARVHGWPGCSLMTGLTAVVEATVANAQGRVDSRWWGALCRWVNSRLGSGDSWTKGISEGEIAELLHSIESQVIRDLPHMAAVVNLDVTSGFSKSSDLLKDRLPAFRCQGERRHLPGRLHRHPCGLQLHPPQPPRRHAQPHTASSPKSSGRCHDPGSQLRSWTSSLRRSQMSEARHNLSF